MAHSKLRQVPVVRRVRDQYGERVVVTLEAIPEAPDLVCDCTACNAQLQGAPTLTDAETPERAFPADPSA